MLWLFLQQPEPLIYMKEMDNTDASGNSDFKKLCSFTQSRALVQETNSYLLKYVGWLRTRRMDLKVAKKNWGDEVSSEQRWEWLALNQLTFHLLTKSFCLLFSLSFCLLCFSVFLFLPFSFDLSPSICLSDQPCLPLQTNLLPFCSVAWEAQHVCAEMKDFERLPLHSCNQSR